jgi:hypothetical protein
VGYKKRGGDGEEELRKVGSTDVLMTRYRHGAAYLEVCGIYPFLLSFDVLSSRLLMSLFRLVGADDGQNNWRSRVALPQQIIKCAHPAY